MSCAVRRKFSRASAVILGAPVVAAGVAVQLPQLHPRPAPAYQRLLAAVAHSAAVKSEHFSLTEAVSMPGGTQTSGTVKATGEIAGSGASAVAELSMILPGTGSIELRMVPPDLYAHLPAAAANLLGITKPWISVNVDTLAKAKLGGSFSQLMSASSTWAVALAALKAVSSKVTVVGTAPVRGVPTTAYRATVNLAKAAAGSKLTTTQVTRLESTIGQSSLPIEVWVDHNDLVRQVTYAATVHPHKQSPAVHLDSTIDLYDFGVPVSVGAPPASEVQNFTSKVLSAAGG